MIQNTTNKYYVYGHYRNDTNQLFYVGKGKDNRAWSKRNRNQHWKRIVEKHGYTIYYFCIDISEQDAFDLEVAIITDLNPECNYTKGGLGGNAFVKWTPEQVKELMAKRVYTKSVASYGFKGRKHSEETKQRMRVSQLKRLPNSTVNDV